MRTSRLLYVAVLGLAALPLYAQKKPLDHSVYDGWKSIRGTTLSRDGKWLAYVVAPQEGDATGTLRRVSDGKTLDLPRASSIQFSKDGHYALASIAPGFEEARKARRDNVKAEDQPKASLAIVDLSTLQTTTIERVASFSLPREDSGWISYRPEPPKSAPAPTAPDKKDQDQRPGGRQGRPGAATAAAGSTPAARGATIVLRNLSTAKETKLEFVDASTWDKYGKTFAYSLVADKDGKGGGVGLIDPATGTKTVVADAKGKYPRVALDDDARSLAFTTDKDDQKAKKPSLSLYCYDIASKKLSPVTVPTKDWTINEGSGVSFTESGKRLLFATSPKPVDVEDKTPADEKVSVDIWTYKDPLLMPAQLLAATRERTRGYQAIYTLDAGTSVQIETPESPNVQLGDRGDGRYGLAVIDIPYRIQSTWDPGTEDVYVVDLTSGARRPIFTAVKGNYSMSPTGDRIAAFMGERKEWLVVDLATGKQTEVKLPYPVYDELDDHPDIPPAYGLAGWTKNDGRVLIQDKFDIWSCDPTGASAPVNLTNGRLRGLRFSEVDLDPDSRFVDVDNLPLTALQDDTKQGGLYWRRNGSVEKIFLGDKRYLFTTKAKDADTLVFTRQDTTEYPDLWLTNVKFENPVKVTEANPQQKNYNWLKGELVRWTSLDGIPLQGILYKPEDFDYGKKYPMIAYFYERSSETLNNYMSPAPSASTINIPLFVSQGYLVFVPDIPYKIGDPGLSALNAIAPGVNSIVSRGYVDPKRLGIQGQSWGGYQVAYLVTATNMFAAAEAGAPVSDMFSAYGGVRYGSGVLRQMQYEHGQSRIGGTPWDSFIKYVENSPVFHADRIQTPLMIMSNDKDGAVPHTQGIEFMSALRRLGKPAWMVVYNDEDHNLVQRKNRKDLSIRLSQFFDHFLKGAPMPVWMEKGVPAVDKGRTMGTELVKP